MSNSIAENQFDNEFLLGDMFHYRMIEVLYVIQTILMYPNQIYTILMIED